MEHGDRRRHELLLRAMQESLLVQLKVIAERGAKTYPSGHSSFNIGADACREILGILSKAKP